MAEVQPMEGRLRESWLTECFLPCCLCPLNTPGGWCPGCGAPRMPKGILGVGDKMEAFFWSGFLLPPSLSCLLLLGNHGPRFQLPSQASNLPSEREFHPLPSPGTTNRPLVAKPAQVGRWRVSFWKWQSQWASSSRQCL